MNIHIKPTTKHIICKDHNNGTMTIYGMNGSIVTVIRTDMPNLKKYIEKIDYIQGNRAKNKNNV